MAELGRRTVASALPWTSSLSWTCSSCRSPLAQEMDYANGRLHCGAAQVIVRFKRDLGLFVIVFAVSADVFVFLLFARASGSVAWVSGSSRCAAGARLGFVSGRSWRLAVARHQGHGVLGAGVLWVVYFYS